MNGLGYLAVFSAAFLAGALVWWLATRAANQSMALRLHELADYLTAPFNPDDFDDFPNPCRCEFPMPAKNRRCQKCLKGFTR